MEEKSNMEKRYISEVIKRIEDSPLIDCQFGFNNPLGPPLLRGNTYSPPKWAFLNSLLKEEELFFAPKRGAL